MQMTQVNGVKGSAVNSNAGQISPGLGEELNTEAVKERQNQEFQMHKGALEVLARPRLLSSSWLKSYYAKPLSNCLNRASSMTGTPSSCALANFDPGSVPTNT